MEKVASIGGKELSKEQRQRYGNSLHWALGAGAGAVYGALRERAPWASLGFGTLFGVLFWLTVDEGANTLFGLTPPPQVNSRGRHMAVVSPVMWSMALPSRECCSSRRRCEARHFLGPRERRPLTCSMPT